MPYYEPKVGIALAASNTTYVTDSVVLSGTNGDVVSTSGSTIYMGPALRSGYNPYPDIEKVTGQHGQGTLAFDPQVFPAVQFDRLIIPVVNTNSSNSSGSHTLSFWVGLYTRNISTLSLLMSTSASTAVTHSGTAGSYSWYSGQRLLTVPWTTTVSANEYWIGVISRTTSGGANGSYSMLHGSNMASNYLGIFGTSNNTTMQLTLGQGVYTATTSALPASVGFTQIRGSDSMARRPVFIVFASSTV